MSSSDDAMRLAGELVGEIWYPRMADLVALAITHCTLHATPLDDDQATQLYRAAFEAGDGIFEKIAHTIDHQTILAFRRELEATDEA